MTFLLRNYLLYQLFLVTSHFHALIKYTGLPICRAWLIYKRNLAFVDVSNPICIKWLWYDIFFCLCFFSYFIKNLFQLNDWPLQLFYILSCIGRWSQSNRKVLMWFFLLCAYNHSFGSLRLQFGLTFLRTNQSFALEVIITEAPFGDWLKDGWKFLLFDTIC